MSQDTFVDDFDSFIEPDTQTGPRLLEDRFDEETAFQFVIAGIGQCGNNLAASFWQTGYRRVLLINTALTDLDPLPKEIARLLIGKQGAGKNPEEARERVLAAKTKIRSALSSLYQKGNKIVLCMGLGGGTGSGGGPETVRIAKELVKERGGDTEKDVIVIATLPEPSLDGDRQCFNALKAYGELSRLEVPVLTVDNTQIRKIIRTTLDDYWTQMNRWVVRTFHQFNVYAARPSNMGVGLDGKDLEDTLSRGRFIFSAFLVRTLGQQAAENIMTDHLEKSLFARTKLSTAEAAACILILNRPAVRGKSTEDISGIFEALNSLMKNASTLHKGSYLEDVPLTAKGASPPDLFCYVMLGGLDHPWETLNALFDRARRCSEEYGSVSAFLTA